MSIQSRSERLLRVRYPWKCSSRIRYHHVLKTFWGWHDEQLRDGTIIWTSPAGDEYVTHPGGALIFPGLSVPTGPLPAAPLRATERGGDKTAMMPRRTRTRAQSRTDAITAERRANHQRRTAATPKPYVPDEHLEYADTFTEASDPDPPPF
jgi:hypothetical protein